jgi:hypothetical protein
MIIVQLAPYIFLVLGILLLALAPIVIRQLRENPLGMIRSEYQSSLPVGCAYVLGSIIIAIAIAGGFTCVFIALKQLGVI